MGLTRPEPVLKNRFLVPECDFSLSAIGADEEKADVAPIVIGAREDEASDIGRMNRVRRDMVNTSNVRVDR
jgi:hypothetical protein